MKSLVPSHQVWPSPRDLLGTSREQIHKLKIEAKWFISFEIFKNKDSEYQVEMELLSPGPSTQNFLSHLSKTLERIQTTKRTKPCDPSPPWSHTEEGTATTVRFLTMSGWVMNAQQTRERSSRCNHHIHCAGTNLPRRGVISTFTGVSYP